MICVYLYTISDDLSDRHGGFSMIPKSCVLNGPAEQRDGASDQHADANDHENDLSQAAKHGQTWPNKRRKR